MCQCKFFTDTLARLTLHADLLLGSGKLHSEEYWKQLEGLLLNQGMLEYKTVTYTRYARDNSGPESRLYSATSITSAGGSVVCQRRQ